MGKKFKMAALGHMKYFCGIKVGNFENGFSFVNEIMQGTFRKGSW